MIQPLAPTPTSQLFTASIVRRSWSASIEKPGSNRAAGAWLARTDWLLPSP